MAWCTGAFSGDQRLSRVETRFRWLAWSCGALRLKTRQTRAIWNGFRFRLIGNRSSGRAGRVFMSRLNRIIAFVATLSVPLALLGSPHGPAGRVDNPAAGKSTLGAPADCPDTSCGQAGSIPDADTWQAAAAADTPDAYWTYLRRHPAGARAADARSRLERLSVSPEPPLQFAAIEIVPPLSVAESTVGEADAGRRRPNRFPVFLLASGPMHGGAASLTPANGSAVASASMPAVAPVENGGIPGAEQPTPMAASSGGPVAPPVAVGPPARVTSPPKAPASALSFAATARSARTRPSGFKPRRSAPRRLKLSELIAPRAVRLAQTAKAKAVRVRPAKPTSAKATRPPKTSAATERRAASKPPARPMRRMVRSAAPPRAGARSGLVRRMRHGRRIAPAPGSFQAHTAPWPNATLPTQDCIWPFCPAN